MKEKAVEAYLVQRVEALGGRALKLTGYVGIPDRLVLLPRARLFFVELKTVTGQLSQAQVAWQRWIERNGNEWRCLNSRSQVDAFIEEADNAGQ